MTRLVEGLTRRPWLLVTVLVVPLGLPIVVTLVSLATGDTWYPAGDLSHTELMLRAIPSHPPLVGVAARVGTIFDQGSTPGPSMAYLLFPVYALLGRSSWSMVAAVDVVHLLAMAATIWLARRVGGTSAAVAVTVALAVLVRSLAPDFFTEPWNVWVPLFGLALLVVMVWAIVRFHVAVAPWAVLLGSHMVQTHVSYALVVVGLIGLGALWTGWWWWRTDRLDGRHPGRWTGIAVGVGVVAWLPPVVEQLTRTRGNLGRLWDHFGSPDEPAVGLRAAVKAMAGEMNLAGAWLTGSDRQPTDPVNLLGFAAFATLAVAGVAIAWRRRDGLVLSLQAVLAAALLLGLVSTARIFGEFYDYVVRWMLPLAAMVAATSAWAVWRWWAARQRVADGAGSPATAGRVDAVGFALAAIAILVPTALATAASVDAAAPDLADSRLVGSLADQIEPGLDDDARYLLRWHDPASLGGVAYGLVLELEKRGIDLGVDPWGRAAAQPFRVRPEADADEVLWLVVGEESIDAFASRPDAVLLAEADPRQGDDVARSDALWQEIEQGLRAIGRDDLADGLDTQYGLSIALAADLPSVLWQQVAEYRELRLPAAVFSVPTGASLFP